VAKKKTTRKKRKFTSQYTKWERHIFSNLRRIFTWGCSDNYGESLKAAKVGPDLYRCCKCGSLNPRKFINVDHITAVMPLSGWDKSWTDYIHRMFEGKAQVLCKPCHKAKTKSEAAKRKELKKK